MWSGMVNFRIKQLDFEKKILFHRLLTNKRIHNQRLEGGGRQPSASGHRSGATFAGQR
jgi:hypothetical protein